MKIYVSETNFLFSLYFNTTNNDNMENSKNKEKIFLTIIKLNGNRSLTLKEDEFLI